MLSCGAAFPWGRFRGLWPGMLDPEKPPPPQPDPACQAKAPGNAPTETQPRRKASRPQHGNSKNKCIPKMCKNVGGTVIFL
ncbi:hypothetical protein K070079E91_25450 [Eisenbergiella porci]